MVIINDIKYACQACIKGHRSSSCAHTDRPLFEIKKKGRPPTQCSHCRDLRKKKQIHVKCMCEARDPLILDTSQIAEGMSTNVVSSAKGKAQAKKKKKDITLSAPALPNGLKDVKDLSLVNILKKEEDDSTIPKSSGKGKAKLETMAKQCLCRVGGECNCFTEKHVSRKDSPNNQPTGSTLDSSSSSGSGCCSSIFPPPISHDYNLSSTPSSSSSPAHSVHSNLPSTPMTLPAPFADYFPSPLSTHEPVASSSSSHMSASSSSRYSSSGQLANRPIPSYLSRSSHYTPYPQTSSHPSNRLQVRNFAEPVSSASKAASPEEILRRGLKELVGNYVRARMETSFVPLLLSKESNESPSARESSANSTLAPELKSEVEGLSGLSEMYKDAIGDVLMVSTCTCGKDCKCPSCKEHGNYPEGGDNGAHVDCPETCSSCFNCSSSVALPANLTTVADLFSASVAMLPPSNSSNSQFMLKSVDQDSPPVNTQFSKDAFDTEHLPKIECCDGQCQCPPGECTCMKDCCGCCEKCLCDSTALGLEGLVSPEKDTSIQQEITAPAPHIEYDEINTRQSHCGAKSNQLYTMPPPSSTMEASYNPSLADYSISTSAGQSSCCSKTQRTSPPSSLLPPSQTKPEGSGGCCSKRDTGTYSAFDVQSPSLAEDATLFGRGPSNPTSTAMFPDLHQPDSFTHSSEVNGKSDLLLPGTANELVGQACEMLRDGSGLEAGEYDYNWDLELAIAAALGDTGQGFNLAQPPLQQQNDLTRSMAFAAHTETPPMDPPEHRMDLNAILASIAAQSNSSNPGRPNIVPSSSSGQRTANEYNKPADFITPANAYMNNRSSPLDSPSLPIYPVSKDSPIQLSSHSSSSIASSNRSLPIAPPERSTTPDAIPTSFDLDQYLHQVLNVTQIDNSFSASNSSPSSYTTPSSFTSHHNLEQLHPNKSEYSGLDPKMYHRRETNTNRIITSHGPEYPVSNTSPAGGYHNQPYLQHPQQEQPQLDGLIRYGDGLDLTSNAEGQVDWVSLGL